MSLWTTPQPNNYHARMHPGQAKAWRSERRFVVVLAGTQGGKTSWGPLWLKREIDRRGPGDYLAVTASYDLFKLKMLPTLRETFEHVYGTGRYWAGDRVIELADPTIGRFRARRADDPMWGRIILRSAESGAGLESNTANGAWLDEAGQDGFTLATWEAVLRRLSLSQGRALLTTTIYNLGWLKTALYDRRDRDPAIDVIQFDSIANPRFPRAEWERARRELPDWKFNMFYRGRYERPAGLIYDCFLDGPPHVCARFAIPDDWQRYLGLDFGGVNTAAVFFAEEPVSKKLYLYREYLAGGRSAKEHAAALRQGEPMIPWACGGAKSEGQWRREFRMAGLPIAEPDIKEVEVGINRVYGAFRRNEIVMFEDCTGVRDELRSYSRVLDANGDPTEAIEDKATYHRLDAMRYIVGRIRRGA